jgi:hypothetical protein
MKEEYRGENPGDGGCPQDGPGSTQHAYGKEPEGAQVWAVEVYKGKRSNMEEDGEEGDSGSVHQSEHVPSTAVERFHERKFRSKVANKSDKRATLKVQGGGSTKKQKTPFKDYENCAGVSGTGSADDRQRWRWYRKCR